jgi:hypothetical protein
VIGRLRAPFVAARGADDEGALKHALYAIEVGKNGIFAP